MGEEKLAGSYVVCSNCGTRAPEKEDGNVAAELCQYCGKNNLVKVEVRVLNERANTDGMSAGANAALWLGAFFLLIGGRFEMGLIGAAIGFGLGYWQEVTGRNRL